MIKQLNDMLCDLGSYKNSNKSELMQYYVSNRLNESLISYYKSLSDSYRYLINRNELNVAKKMNRM